MNEFRRDPMSGRWTIIEHRKKIDFKTLLSRKRVSHKKRLEAYIRVLFDGSHR